MSDRHDPESSAPDIGGLDWLQTQLDVPAPPEPAAPVAPEPARPVAPEAARGRLETPADQSTSAPRSARSAADLEPAPWWVTPAQAPLVPTTEEVTQLLPAASSVPPLPLDVAGPAADAAPASRPVAADTEAAATAGSGAGTTSGAGGTGGTPRTLLWVAVGLLAVVILIGLFFLGQKIGAPAAPVSAPTPAQTPTETPTPTPTPEVTGTQPAGDHAWNALGGGECLQPYTSPWSETFTVVDCGAAHAAQLVYRGVFAVDRGAAFPGEAALAAQINALCSAPGVIDLAGAGSYPDLQVQGSYPITAEQWKSGQHHYYCFVNRSSGAPLTASIAGLGPTPAG